MINLGITYEDIEEESRRIFHRYKNLLKESEKEEDYYNLIVLAMQTGFNYGVQHSLNSIQSITGGNIGSKEKEEL